jgi:diguanylate cyclase (GGDEF)-like protein/PAS domain S-box-containing protein
MESGSHQEIEVLRIALSVARHAVSADSAEVFAGVQHSLQALAEVLGVDYVFFDRVDQSAGRLWNVAGWCSPTIEGFTTNIGGHDLDAVQQWVGVFAGSRVHAVADTWDEDTWWDLKQFVAQAERERATLSVSLVVRGEVVGILGMGMLTGPRAWSSFEVEMTTLIADTLAGVIERERLDRALQSSERHFRLLTEAAVEIIVLTDAHGAVTYVTPSVTEILGFHPEELVGRTMRSFAAPGQSEPLDAARALLVETGTARVEFQMLTADGGTVWVTAQTRELLDTQTGEREGFRLSLQDVTETKHLQERLTDLAMRDSLTGLFNRRELSRRLDRFIARGGEALSLLVMDLDGFKEINDTHGHHVGDRVLITVAQRIEQAVRPGDVVARLGGDEFVVLCRDTSSRNATALAERVVRSVARSISSADGGLLHVTASIGVASAAVGWTGSADDLLREADAAMYRAKAANGDQVHVSSKLVA